MSRRLSRLLPAVTATVLLVPSASAQVAPTGSLSATTLKLPDGPGSVTGLAKPAELDLFSAQVEYSIPIKVPSAGGLSPTVALAYSGALGNGPLGIGWSLASPAIRRSLREGVPRYDERDELTIEGVGSGRLVRVRGNEYVAEGAGCTLRVRRVDSYFEVTDSEGTRYTFGRTAPARLGAGDHTAAWFLEEVVNLAGERMRFEYVTDAGQVYLQRILWGPDERYRVDVVLESRSDDVTAFSTGFEVTTARRIREIRSIVALPGARPQEVARYTLAYRGGGVLGELPVSRLHSVTMTGRRDADGNLLDTATVPPVQFDYALSAAARSWQLDAGGWVLEQRGVALLDVDGDGADDLLRLEPGYAAWRRNVGGRFGAAQPFDNANALELGRVRFADVDGDARPEIVRIVDDTWRAYGIVSGAATSGLSPGRALEGTRAVGLGGGTTVLADINGDGRTDVLEAVTGGLRMRRGIPVGFAPPAYLPPISVADRTVEPGASGVRFVDANGDGLADAVWLTDAWMKVYLGRGDGTFVPRAKVFYPWSTGAIPLDHIHLVDLDRDGLLDLVRVDAGKVRWFGGLAAGRFDRVPRQLDRPPGSDADVRVTFADIDGNGSEDVVWANRSGMWALDLAGGTTRAMIASIDDGMGEVTHIAYGASTQLAWEAERQGQPWTRKLPSSVAVPIRQDTVYADGTPTRVVSLGVRDGFWDGDERRFGGFLAGSTQVSAETAAQRRVETTTFHVGAGDERVLRGRPIEQRVEDGAGTLFTVATSGWEALRPRCLDAAIDASNPLLRRAALRRRETAHHEGVTTPIRTLVEIDYDAEARVYEERNLGRLDLTGDELVTRKDYGSDDTTWVRDRVISESLRRGDGTVVALTRHRFGNHLGEPLPYGQIGFGWPRLSEGYLWQEGSRPTTPRWVALSSSQYDAHGNVVQSTSGPAADAAGLTAGVTRTFVYDSDGLFPLSESVTPAPGRVLTWTASWDQYLGAVEAVRAPDGNTTHVDHDGLGRVTALRQNSLPAHQRYAYDWTAPRPRTYSYAFDGEQSKLTAAASDWNRTDRYRGWRHSVTVADSAGDALFTAGRLAANQWLVSGWKRKDGRGRVIEVLEGFTHRAAELPTSPPSGLRRQILRYDALDRAYEHELPTGALTRTTFKAFEQTVVVDGLAPVTSRLDGQGRIIHTERTVPAATGAPSIESVDATYDAAGRILALELQRPAGTSGPAPCSAGSAVPWVSHCFVYDSFGRLVEADDPDIGLRQMTYDDSSRLVRHVNGAGQGISLSYDRAGRLTRRLADDGTKFEYAYDTSIDGVTPVLGHLAWVKEPHGRVDFDYDQFGRNSYLLRTIDGPGGTRLFHETTYAPSGAVIAHGYVRSWSARHVFDMAGRVVKIVGQQGSLESTLWEATSFDEAGRLTGERFGNGVTGAYTFDRNGQTASVAIAGTDGTPLYGVGLTRNDYGAVIDAVDTDDRALDHTAHFDYDPAGRLLKATLAPSSRRPDQPFTFHYRYDGLQNMVSRTADAPRTLGQYLGAYCYGQNGAGPRQLTSVVAAATSPGANPCAAPTAPPVAAFTYDDAGRQLTDSGARMTYDGLDQLVSVELADGLRVEYAYGYDGQRIRTTDNRGSVPEHWITPELREQGGAVEQYVKLGDRIIAKVDLRYFDETDTAAGTRALITTGRTVGAAVLGVIVVVLVGLGLGSAGRRRSWRPALATLLVVGLLTPGCGALFGTEDSALWRRIDTVYFHTGFAAGPVLLTSETGVVLDERRYEPFGQPLESRGATSGLLDVIDFALEPFNILNKPTDPRTGWSYHGARWMAPQTARWLSPDPPVKAPDAKFMASPWKLHPYQYVDQNPVLYWDPDGQENRDVEWTFKTSDALPFGTAEHVNRVERFAWGFPYRNDPLSTKLLEHYMDGTGEPMVLNQRDMLDANPVANIWGAEGFSPALRQLYERGGGTVAFAGQSTAFAQTNGSLGTFTLNWVGTITVKPDLSWSFSGHVSFYDRYNFDPKPFFGSRRTFFGEVKTRVADTFLPGTGFAVHSVLLPVTQQERDDNAVWPEESEPVMEDMFAEQVEVGGGAADVADTE